ncbi:glycosyltransferase family 4 protein [Gemmobacter denitrificans]|uniref:Glycosyltransferase family 4 protein n=1 Tax=Gemmobacter denitrificans TaxID=3123040 RepID=A0ABU8BRB5_9RHOB
MAVLSHPLAVDDPPMMPRDAKPNAAIYFAADGYDPTAKGINGRRVAGESFIRGFFRHADVQEFVSFLPKASESAHFDRLAGEERPDLPRRHLALRQGAQLAGVGTLYYPSPNFGAEAWRRAAAGAAAWSICGVTHTISTKGVMQGFLDLRMAPQMEWDAVICTSRAVQSAVLTQLELIDDHLRARFGGGIPARPQLPVIPLGIDTAAFVPDKAAGAALRKRLGLGAKDVLFTTIARLTPFEKFDPYPLYLALQQAQAAMPKGKRLHLALCGIFNDDYSRKVFESGAPALMPDVGFHLLDGAKAEERKAVLSGADAFVFAIDNIQETFGLAPIEAMAAGLPVVVSDWDGMRDTITADVGIRVPTRTLAPAHAEAEGFRHITGVDSYGQYCSLTSQMTAIDVSALAGALQALALDAGLRARLGAAGQARARALYDWAAVIPQMQALWAELATRRAAAGPARHPPVARGTMPIGPSPFLLFGSYPTRAAGFDTARFVAMPLQGRPGVTETLALRNYGGIGRSTERAEDFAALYDRILAAGAEGAARSALLTTSGKTPVTLDRLLIWLLKYDFIRLSGEDQSRK